MAEWELVGTPATSEALPQSIPSEWESERSAADWLEAQGLGKYAAKILEVTGAETLSDMKLIDPAMADQIVKDADLKMVSAKKFVLALAELRSNGPASAVQGAAVEGASAPVEQAEEAPPAPPVLQERIVVCLDRSGSMGSPFKEVTLNVVQGETKSSVAERSRMEAVKVMFYAFRDRIESLGSASHELGLLQFDHTVERMLNLTRELDKFESIVDNVQKRGQTAIYSSIIEATRMLRQDFDEASKIDLRVLVLTDGQNNSGASPEEALAAVNAIGATVDAIIVGDRPDSNLRRIVTATEGQCYNITSLGEGFELLEAESVVSLKARRGGVEKKFVRRENVQLDCVDEIELTMTADLTKAAVKKKKDKTAALKVGSLASMSFASDDVDDAAALSSSKRESKRADCGGGASETGAAANQRRIMKELAAISKGQTDDPAFYVGLHVFPSPDDLHSWKVLMEGPDNSPFKGGVFELSVTLPSSYPLSAPSIEFVTPIYHCNVNDVGKICMDVLFGSWSPALTVHKVLMMIRALLSEPNPNDSMRQWIAELTIAHMQSNGQDTRYYDQAKESVQQHATRTVEEWKQLWGVA